MIDCHTHVYTDALAPRVIQKLSSYDERIKPSFDGTLTGLLKQMDDYNVDKSVVLNICVKPNQEENVNKFAIKINGDRIISLGSVNPASDDVVSKLEYIKDNGLVGIKLHPEYQHFNALSDEAMLIYEQCEKLGLIVYFHCGFDVAFPDSLNCPPEAVAKIVDQFEELTVVAGHMGGTCHYQEVYDKLAGKRVYLDTSMSSIFCDKDLFYCIIKKHGADRVLWGTDSPWNNIGYDLNYIRSIIDDDKVYNMITDTNAAKLFK